MKKNRKNNRFLNVKVKTAKGRKISSINWLQRQLNDPYVKKAKLEGYFSRAAYKLIEIIEKFSLINSSSVVVDIGAAPGGWTQVALEKVKKNKGGKVISIDVVAMAEIKDAIIITHDFPAEDIEEVIRPYLEGQKADLIMSDMAASSCGHSRTDHLKIIALCEASFLFAKNNLKIGGNFITKILKGGSEHELLTDLKKSFREIKHFKPPSSRQNSAESYLIALGFRE